LCGDSFAAPGITCRVAKITDNFPVFPDNADYAKNPDSPKVLEAMFPNGHFYSPVVDPDGPEVNAERSWATDPDILGVDFNDAADQAI
jgi:hypothetical protein